MTTLQTISMELQKTYSCPPAMTYIPCAGEVCAVQFSSDMVSKDTFKRVVKMQLHRITDCCLCFYKYVELVQRPSPDFGHGPEEGQYPLH